MLVIAVVVLVPVEHWTEVIGFRRTYFPLREGKSSGCLGLPKQSPHTRITTAVTKHNVCPALCSPPFFCVALMTNHSGKQPGWDRNSWGFHSDDGCLHHRCYINAANSTTFGPGDTVGCGLLYPRVRSWRALTSSLFFGLDANFVGVRVFCHIRLFGSLLFCVCGKLPVCLLLACFSDYSLRRRATLARESPK